MIFGNDAIAKAKALKTFLDSVPKMVGPSGTAQGLEIFKMFNIMSQGASVSRQVYSKMLENLGQGKDIFTQTGKVLTKEVGGFNVPTALGITAVKGLRPPQRDNRGLQLPKDRE